MPCRGRSSWRAGRATPRSRSSTCCCLCATTGSRASCWPPATSTSPGSRRTRRGTPIRLQLRAAPGQGMDPSVSADLRRIMEGGRRRGARGPQAGDQRRDRAGGHRRGRQERGGAAVAGARADLRGAIRALQRVQPGAAAGRHRGNSRHRPRTRAVAQRADAPRAGAGRRHSRPEQRRRRTPPRTGAYKACNTAPPQARIPQGRPARRTARADIRGRRGLWRRRSRVEPPTDRGGGAHPASSAAKPPPPTPGTGDVSAADPVPDAAVRLDASAARWPPPPPAAAPRPPPPFAPSAPVRRSAGRGTAAARSAAGRRPASRAPEASGPASSDRPPAVRCARARQSLSPWPQSAAPQRRPRPPQQPLGARGGRSRAPSSVSWSRTFRAPCASRSPRSSRCASPGPNVQALAEGLQGGGAAYRHEVTVTKAMSVRLRAPDGGFFIETASPETQWIEKSVLAVIGRLCELALARDAAREGAAGACSSSSRRARSAPMDWRPRRRCPTR